MVAWGGAPDAARARALARLEAEADSVWVAWDPDTKVPNRIITAGIETPGVMASAAQAERMAWDLLAKHLDLLAPGASPSAFVAVSNERSGGIRTVGFEQLHHGVPVVGGQISFRFKADRLVAIGSEALPDVFVPPRSTTVEAEVARAAAEAWIADELPGSIVAVERPRGPMVLPLLDAAGVRYAEVMVVEVDVRAPASRWRVYVDVQTGKPVAREQTLHFASATIAYNVPERGPLGAREDRAAPLATILDGGDPLVTNAFGQVSFASAPTTLGPTLVGPLVAVRNDVGEDAVGAFEAFDGSTVVWDARTDELVDAQLSAFVHTSLAKAYVRAIDPGLAWLDGQIDVTVNIEDECNAFSDGDSINFYQASNNCENTGRIADVVYHEFGHSVHHQSLIPGAGLFNTGLSEGTSDYLSATITNDSGVARGFFFDDQPLREIDPEGFEYRWPEDRGEVHDEGRIISGALWDLRKLLIAKLGTGSGVTHADRIWYEATRRAVDIPSMYVEALIVDDDDGDLSNGTPNGCEINAAFGAHGLFAVGEGGQEQVLPIEELTPRGYPVRLLLSIPVFPGCPLSASPELEWRVRGEQSSTIVPMVPAAGGYEGFVTGVPAGEVVQYRVLVNYDTGTERSLPDNFVDPWYEYFVGEVIPLYCTGFADGAAGWSLGPGWQAGPLGGASASDPSTARDADGVVLGLELEGEGNYAPFSDTDATSPIVDTAGHTNVRLQYWRWLTVEDGFFDRAAIDVDGTTVWENHTSDVEELATFHHVDKEWRFQDVDIGEEAADGQVELTFGLQSDAGLHFGGWTLDQLCVVAFSASGQCGNGLLEAGEQCDDGNDIIGDGCTPECTSEDVDPDPTGGPGGSGGSGDTDGGTGDTGGFDTDGPSETDPGLVGRGCGCTSVPVGGAPWLLGLSLAGLGLRRRRRLR